MRKTFIALLISVLALNSCIYTDPDILYIDGGADIAEYIEDIDIDWDYGSVVIRYWENNYVSFYEEDYYSRPIDQPMCYYLKDGKLRIKYYRHSNSNRQYKKLCLNVPQGIVFKSLEIDSNDASIDVDLDAEYLDFDSVNGSIIYSTIYRYTKDIDIDSVNGEVNIILPVDAGFRLDFNSVSGSLYSEFNLFREGDSSFSYGSRYTDIDVDTVNSDLYLSFYEMQ